IRSLEFNVDNNPALPGSLASKYPVTVAKGQAVVSGTLDAYFESDALLTKAINHTETELLIRLDDADGGAIVIWAPSIYLKPNSLADSDNLYSTSLEFDARKDPTFGTTLQIDIFPAA